MVRTVAALLLTLTALPGAPAASGAGAPPTCGGLEATIVGTSGDDAIVGTEDDDVIVGRGGDDDIVGGLGKDRICGGSGDDSLQGHGDTDHLYGGSGEDYIDGGVGGCCERSSNSGDDVISGGLGDDTLHSADFSAHGSTIHGRQGADTIFIYSGGVAYGNKGRDDLPQWSGDTTLDGGRGADALGNGNDPSADHVTMLGGAGRDTLSSVDATGTTTMDGGRGRDRCTDGTTTVHCEH